MRATFLTDMYTLAAQRATASHAGPPTTEALHREVDRLAERVDKLVLTNVALWTLLREHLNLTDAQLEERVRQIDLADGMINGKIGAMPWNCPKCTRPNSPRHHRCLYCGQEVAKHAPFPLS